MGPRQSTQPPPTEPHITKPPRPSTQPPPIEPPITKPPRPSTQPPPTEPPITNPPRPTTQPIPTEPPITDPPRPEECEEQSKKLIGQVLSTIPDLHEMKKCIKRCTDHADCKAWVWLNNNMCQILKDVTGTEDNSNAVSG